MARLDNRSDSEHTVLLFEAQLGPASGETQSVDISEYTAYNISMASLLTGTPTFSATVQISTSESPTSGFTAVDDNLLSNGSNPFILNETTGNFASLGFISLTRAVFDQKKFLRLDWELISVAGGTVILIGSINGMLKAKPSVREGVLVGINQP